MEQVKRVYSNIQALLHTGTWTGEYAPHLAEAQRFVADVLNKLQPPVEAPSVDAQV